MIKVLVVLVPGVVVVALLFFLVPLFDEHSDVQPISYNHKVHIESAGLNCTECHSYVDKLARASIPTLDLCQNCHSESPLSESPEEEKLLKYVAEGKEIPWVRIYKVPDHVYFSHRRHVVGGELECVVCHGDVAEQTEPVVRPAVPMTMEYCMSCHKQQNVSNDCLACHR